jgi:predicted transport protein
LDEDIAAKVAKAYLAYREQQHLARNNNQLKTWVAVDAMSDERHAVMAAWAALFG